MSKKYGYFYEEEIDRWERLPANSLILTSSYMGAWLQRRDERKGNRELLEELEKIKAEINEEDEKGIYYECEEWIEGRPCDSDYFYGLKRAIMILDKRISELKGENNA